MHGAFGTVVIVVCVVALLAALVALLLSRRTWEDYGRRGLTFDSEQPQSSQTATAETEIRELVEAQNARRAQRGEPPLDVEQELAKLSSSAPAPSGDPHSGSAPTPSVDPELRDEIRQLVIARSSRLVRAGKPPLDVEREVERELARLARTEWGDSG